MHVSSLESRPIINDTSRILHINNDNVKIFFFFQAEDGIRDQPRSRGLGDVYKRQFMTTGVSNPVRYPRFRA